MKSPITSAIVLLAGTAVLASPLMSSPAAASSGTAARDQACTAPSGPYQWQLEKKLKLAEDGVQSTEDCIAIRDLQRTLGIKPADGRADLKTYRTLLVHEVRKNPNAQGKCPVRSYRVTCVDLNRQILWVQKSKRVIFAPVPIRSGKDGYETRTGWHKIYLKHERHFSTLYNNAPMPYSQFFDGGQAFHGTKNDLFKSGSHGCVNMYESDAKRLFELLDIGDRVYVWGTKPGTGDRAMPSNGVLPDDVLIAQGFGADGIAEDPSVASDPLPNELEAGLG
ncbi:L,D-transpeptidase [Streptomyces sp. NPDC050145]|uniref:L,D-transpeptidase n=1 Tax=Streptomyces sp. NPDC050145 TaxID=3365602 RepID=UPI0037927C6C